MTSLPRIPIIRAIFWLFLAFLGICQAWAARHSLLSDGISYIEIGQAYLRHDWPQAINAYWSPLYSWFLAALFFVLNPSPYWQAAVAHLALLLVFIAAGLALEYFLHNLSYLIDEQREWAGSISLSRESIYVAAYSAFLFAGLSLVGLGYCSPDMISFALTFFLCGAVLRIQRSVGSDRFYVLFGLVCGLFFLARTAFAASFAVFLTVIWFLLRRQKRPVGRPLLLIVASAAILTVPFVVAISLKHGSFTIGESGRLNYGWELAGAHRWIDWQGEPFHNIGVPKHPTVQVLESPRTFVFSRPIGGSYPPWYDPSYWYDGIRPTVNIPVQLKALGINLSVAANYFWRSPIVLPALLLIFFGGVSRWWLRFLGSWPVLLPMLSGIALYCVIYFEKRYVAANLVVLWVLMLAALSFPTSGMRRVGNALVIGCALLFILAFVGVRQRHVVKLALTDLVQRHEEEQNVDYLIAQRLLAAGLHKGDSVAFIGAGINADWARIAGVRIVAEVPLMYRRASQFLNDSLIDDDSQIKAFWQASDAQKARVLSAFQKAGARMVVTDGFFCSSLTKVWPKVLPADEARIPKFQKDVFNDLNSRYLLLGDSTPKLAKTNEHSRGSVNGALPEVSN